ncbi:glycoside hydrolase family 140 protein [Chroococcidiopsis thermalis]|uniref:DUF4038 domain-containing protein n=1 Tax=Chroococcidiopsis thermalis (strain PCC 7203) TaxID=251229 RepID=K9TYX8_CHRTP|nr:glycoside hydrolase family 140 protein [Chroococcidiopsis thermalis]AFY88047.1 hypothetical protein Chro_2571 [Chroococcidiopsis thermalis PCC 7203]
MRRFLLWMLPLAVCFLLSSCNTVMAGARTSKLSQLRVSHNGRFLVKEDGSPFFWLGDTSWAILQKATREDAHNQPSVLRYLEDRAAKRFNVIQCRLVRNAESTNAYGQAAFIRGNFARPQIANGANNDYWDMADWFVAQAEAHGLYLALLPIWANNVPNHDPIVQNPAIAYRYGHFLGNRWRHKSHLIWVMGGDPVRERDVDNPERLRMTRAIAEGIADGTNGDARFDGQADYSTTLMTYHPRGGGRSSSRHLHQEKWLDFNMIQTTTSFEFRNYKTIAADYAKEPPKPTLDAEVAYENSLSLSRNAPPDKRIQPWHVRKAAYWAVFAGGFGHTYGHRSFIGWVREGEHLGRGADIPWFKSLDAPGAGQMTYLRNLMESQPFLTRIPDRSSIANGQSEQLDRIQATRNADGSYVMLYLPTSNAVTIQMDKISGERVKARWFNPRQGTWQAIGEFAAAGTKRFVPPSHERDRDWVLVLERAD